MHFNPNVFFSLNEICNHLHLIGIFSNSHLSYEDVRDKSDKGQPSLSELTITALSILTVNDKNNGFVLVVEGGRIDHAHHENWATRAMEETVALHQTVQDSVSELERKGLLEDTLIIVTSDHSHVMSMMGYGKRGTDIRGKVLGHYCNCDIILSSFKLTVASVFIDNLLMF